MCCSAEHEAASSPGSGAVVHRARWAALLAVCCLASQPAVALQERQVWDLTKLAPGRVYPTTATAFNESCRGKHDFELTVEGTPWFRITGDRILRKIGVGERKTSTAEVDTRNLPPGQHVGLLRIRCISCPPRCRQDVTELEIRLEVASWAETLDPIPGGSLPPEEQRCGVQDIEGRLQPSQGVWQDDPLFPDRPGKQLKQHNARLLEAELPMVVDRRATVFGTIRPVGATAEALRKKILLRGTSDGSRAIPTKLRLTKVDSSGSQVIWTSPETYPVQVGPPCRPGTATPFRVEADVGAGAGEFAFEAAGMYVIEAELVREDGTPTGIKSRVFGRVVPTIAPKVLFRPITVADDAPDVVARLGERTRDLERRSRAEIPDWFPLANQPLQTRTLDVRSYAPAFQDREALERIIERIRTRTVGNIRRIVLREALQRELKTLSHLSGWDRMLVTLSGPDFGNLRSGPTRRAAAYTNSRKVSFLDIDIAPFTWTVAHELTHTMPFPWTSEQVTQECGVDYHDGLGKQAHGVQITLGGQANRGLREGVLPMFAQATRERPWITQCSYWHLFKALSDGPPDPPVLLVQGYAGSVDGRAAAELKPLYQIDGIYDLEPQDPEGEGWAIELFGASGVLGRFPFRPERVFADTGERQDVFSFSFRLPVLDSLAGVRVAGPGGVLAERSLSPNPPEVSFTAPPAGRADPGTEVRVAWSGTDSDGDELVYTLLYSDDGGATWIDVLFETSDVAATVTLTSSTGPHQLWLLASDGARSAEARLALTR